MDSKMIDAYKESMAYQQKVRKQAGIPFSNKDWKPRSGVGQKRYEAAKNIEEICKKWISPDIIKRTEEAAKKESREYMIKKKAENYTSANIIPIIINPEGNVTNNIQAENVTIINQGNNPSVENYLLLANNAYNGNSWEEADNFCSKALEIAPNNYEVWLIKARASGCLSSRANLKIDLCVQCFSKALEFAPEDKKEEITLEQKSVLQRICNHFSNEAMDEFLNNLCNDISNIEFNNLVASATNLFKYIEELSNKYCADLKGYKNDIACRIGRATGVHFIKIVLL